MPLYRVTFAEPGGARVECYLPAAVGVDHITLAVHHLWGPQCYWAWAPGSDTEGRVYERVGAATGPQDVPRQDTRPQQAASQERTVVESRPCVCVRLTHPQPCASALVASRAPGHWCQGLLGHQPILAVLRGQEQACLNEYLYAPHTDAELLGDCRSREHVRLLMP
jgi:hypothetical protein